MAHFKSLAILALAPLLGGCPGETSNVPAQEAVPEVKMTGTESSGVSVEAQFVYAKGTAGTTREVRTTASGGYSVVLTDLTGPYLLANTLSPAGDPSLVFLTTVAAKPGVANLTPLTTLLTAQLLGLDPSEALTGFNSSPNVETALITDANIKAAQAEVTQFLADAYGLTLKSGAQSFVDAAFTPAAGDPMFDSIVDLNAKLAAKGKTIRAVAQQIAQGIQACQSEAVTLNLNGQDKKFCPVLKSATPEEADVSIVDYLFQDVVQNTLTFKAQGTTVLSGRYQPTGGDPFTCDSGCVGITLGAPAADLTRAITFTNAGFTSTTAAGTAVLTGTLTSAIPSITLPPLPCSDDRFFVIYPNHDVVGQCISVVNPTGIPATLGGGAGPGRDLYSFSLSDPPPTFPHMEITVDYSTPEPTVVSVYYSVNDPDTGLIVNRFACMLSACNGVSLSTKTVATAFGYTFEVRKITLSDTVLSGLNEDGTATGLSVTARASLNVAHDATTPPPAYPTLMACADATADAIDTLAPGAQFNLCISPNDLVNGFLYRTTTDLGDGNLEIALFSDIFDQVYLDLHDTVVTDLRVVLASTNETFECKADCAGITVTGTAGNGPRTVKFAGTVLHNQQDFPLPGDRALKITSPTMDVAPP